METLAYLHLACAYESPDADSPTVDLSGFNFKQFSERFGLLALKLLVPLVIVAIASNALALQRGDSGAAVTKLQNDLRSRGIYTYQVTGYYGSVTEAAVRRFQSERGLTVDGIAGPATLQALSNSSSGGSTQPISYSGGLRQGSRGAEVREVQQQLRQKGYSVSVDGVFGAETDRAVRGFQRSRGLVADGIIGPATRSALSSDYIPPVATIPQTPITPLPAPPLVVETPIADTALKFGSRGTEVSTLQQQLRTLNYYNGSIDGVFGFDTENAVRRFQTASSLPADGVVGPSTRAELNRRYSASPPYQAGTGGSITSPGKYYTVVIPGSNPATVSKVRQYVGYAYLNSSRLGSFISAGRYGDRDLAEQVSRRLRERGLDARVEYR